MPNGRGAGGGGSGQGPAQGQGGGQGRGSGSPGGPSKCVCPNCGYEEPHQRGTPCSETECPECGSRLMGKR